jgi:hypothetical protein
MKLTSTHYSNNSLSFFKSYPWVFSFRTLTIKSKVKVFVYTKSGTFFQFYSFDQRR